MKHANTVQRWHIWLMVAVALLSLGSALTYAGAANQAPQPASIGIAAFIKGSNTERLDAFGKQIAIDGDTMVVTAPYEDSLATGVNGDQHNNGAPRSGAAYVYVNDGGRWFQQAYLKASNTDPDDALWSVDISGDTIVLGSIGESSSARGVNGDQVLNNAPRAGAAYVFVRTNGAWSQQAYLKASNTDQSDGFGAQVAIDGDTIVVSAEMEDSAATGVNGDQSDNSMPLAGAAYVFVRTNGAWSQQAYLKASNPHDWNEFGHALDVSGDTIVISTIYDRSDATGVNGDPNNTNASGAGAAFVFTRRQGVWQQEAYLKASNTEASDFFGTDVAIDGDTIVVTANNEDSAATGANGDQADNNAPLAGAAYVFVRSNGEWSQQAYLKASNPDTWDLFGQSVALDGDTLIVGSLGEASNASGINGNQSNNGVPFAGAAYMFKRANGVWHQQAYFKATRSDEHDRFSTDVAVSGTLIAVSADGDDSAWTGIGGDPSNNESDEAGAVYMFQDGIQLNARLYAPLVLRNAP